MRRRTTHRKHSEEIHGSFPEPDANEGPPSAVGQVHVQSKTGPEIRCRIPVLKPNLQLGQVDELEPFSSIHCHQSLNDISKRKEAITNDNHHPCSPTKDTAPPIICRLPLHDAKNAAHCADPRRDSDGLHGAPVVGNHRLKLLRLMRKHEIAVAAKHDRDCMSGREEHRRNHRSSSQKQLNRPSRRLDEGKEFDDVPLLAVGFHMNDKNPRDARKRLRNLLKSHANRKRARSCCAHTDCSPFKQNLASLPIQEETGRLRIEEAQSFNKHTPPTPSPNLLPDTSSIQLSKNTDAEARATKRIQTLSPSSPVKTVNNLNTGKTSNIVANALPTKDTVKSPEEDPSHPARPLSPFVGSPQSHVIAVPLDPIKQIARPLPASVSLPSPDSSDRKSHTQPRTESPMRRDSATHERSISHRPPRSLSPPIPRKSLRHLSRLTPQLFYTTNPKTGNSSGNEAHRHTEDCIVSSQEIVSRPKGLGNFDTSLRCVKPNSVYLHQIMEDAEKDGMLKLMKVYRLTHGRRPRHNLEAQIDPFLNENTELERWRVAMFHEIAAGLYVTTIEGRLHRLSSRLLSRTETSEGVYLQTISNCTGFELLPLDCVYQTQSNGVHVIGLVVRGGNENGVNGNAVLVLDWFNDSQGKDELYCIGNIRHNMLKVTALNEMCHPRSQLAATLSAFVARNNHLKWQLIQERYKRPLESAEVVLQSRMCSTANGYIESLRQRNILNDQQEQIVKQSVAACDSWHRADITQRAQLNRFLLVSGVPGCGKSHTAVYTIAALLLFYNKEFLRSEFVPYWAGQVLVLSKTNKALDVFLRRLPSVWMPSTGDDGTWTRRATPCFCRRSTSYMNRDGWQTQLGGRQTEDITKLNDVPVILSTFGNLQNLVYQMIESLGGYSQAMEWVALNMKVAIVDEGSQSIALDLAQFVTLFPSFDGIIIINGDKSQIGPVVLSGVERAREYLTRSLFDEFESDLSQSPYTVPYAEMVIQYRMHESIMNLANDTIYKGKMVYGFDSGFHDSKGIPRDVNIRIGRGRQLRLPIGPVAVYSTSRAADDVFKSKDFVNFDELHACRTLICAMLSIGKFREEEIVFLSPYKQQCLAMKEKCMQEKLNVGVHTVAAFQGGEETCIILSLVRRAGGGTGFLKDEAMLGTAITRPTDRLIIVGDVDYFADSIETTNVWKKLLKSLGTRQETRQRSICDAEDLLV